MSPEQNKNSVGIFRLLLGFGIGSLSWLAGFHCIEIDSKGECNLSLPKFSRHFLKVMMWTCGIYLLSEWGGVFMARLGGKPAIGWITPLLIWVVLFLILRFVKKGTYLWVLPGFHRFSCPQCYQSQSFRFQPVSFQFGFWVTYLCPNCACLVNGGGEQIVYPIKISLSKLTPGLLISVPGALVAIGLGVFPGWVLVRVLFGG